MSEGNDIISIWYNVLNNLLIENNFKKNLNVVPPTISQINRSFEATNYSITSNENDIVITIDLYKGFNYNNINVTLELIYPLGQGINLLYTYKMENNYLIITVTKNFTQKQLQIYFNADLQKTFNKTNIYYNYYNTFYINN